MENAAAKAREALESIEAVLSELNINFKKSESDEVFSLELYGDDIVMPVRLWVEPEYSLVMIGSVLPFMVEPQKLDETAIVLNELNSRIVNGAFYLDPEDHYIKFKITDSYLGAPVSKEAIRFNVELLLQTVDKYNDKLLAFNKGNVDRIYFTTCI